jgi:hypothetical protein
MKEGLVTTKVEKQKCILPRPAEGLGEVVSGLSVQSFTNLSSPKNPYFTIDNSID